MQQDNLIKYDKCPICGSSHIIESFEATDYTVSRGTFKVSQCGNCSFLFTNPIPDKTSIGKYYKSDDYISHSDTKKGLINKLYHFIRSYSLLQKEKLLRSYKTSKSLLDFGCGTGYFLEFCKNCKWDTQGYEPDTDANHIASTRINDKVYNSLSELKQDDKKYGIVTAWHVLEHIHELDEAIETIHNKIENKGKFIFALPNPSSKDAQIYKEHWAAYDVPRHLYHFNPNNVEDLLKKHSFKLVEKKPLSFDSFYISMLSEKYKTGKINYIKAFINGLRSNMYALNNDTCYSSIIYIAEKI